MKKFASVVLAVVIAISMFTFVVSASGPAVTATANKSTAKVGDTVTVTVALSGNTGLTCLMVNLGYDSTALEAVSYTVGGLFGFEEVNVANKGLVRHGAMNGNAVTANGTLFTVDFKVLKAGDSNITVSIKEAYDAEEKAVTVATNGTAIKGEAVEVPTEKPTEQPTEKPTEQPTEKPTEQPTEKPTEQPTVKPTEKPDDCVDHKYGEYIVIAKACENKAGKKQASCTVCGDIIEEAIPAGSSDCQPGAWVVVKPATTTAKGEKVQKCKICGEVLQKGTIPMLSSDPITNPAIPNTDAQA